MKIDYALDRAAIQLRDHDVAEPAREAALLVSLAVGKDKTFIIAHPEYDLTPSEKTRLDGFVKRRASREPYQYICGRQEFFGLDFEVSPAVLIPRPETEILVERAIEILGRTERPTRFLEIGVGSGCIAVSILRKVESATAAAVDISIQAISVAKVNADRHLVSDRLNLFVSDVYASILPAAFDLIVSNPPYVPAGDIEGLQPEVRDFEPRRSLTDGGSGLSIIKRIIEGSPAYLTSGGSLLVEIGFDQATFIAPMFDMRVWGKPEFLPDLQGFPRIVCATLQE